MTFEYKEYCISQLRNWVSDALCTGEVDAQEIYDTIKSEVSEHVNALQKQLDNSKRFQNLLLGHREFSFDDFNDASMFYTGYDDVLNTPKTWTRTVEVDGLSGECYITLPDELLELKGWKENDVLDWIDLGNGTFELRKLNDIKTK